MNNDAVIYLDHNSTTPCDERVVSKMIPFFTDHFGNPASRSHVYGWRVEQAVKDARLQVAKLIGAESSDIVFTSGATEACNLAIKGAFDVYNRKGKHIVTMASEHSAVLDTCAYLERLGAEVSYLNPDSDGSISVDTLEGALRQDTCLVAIMWANNETGVIAPIEEIATMCAERGIVFFTDATQAVGKIPIDVRGSNIPLLAFSAHKFYGPKGVGALYVSQKNPAIKLREQINGGGHERNIRSGTLNVPGIIGLGEAAKIAQEELYTDNEHLRTLRDYLEDNMLSIDEVSVNGSIQHRLPNTSNLAFRYTEGKQIMTRCGEVMAVSAGSACTSAVMRPSHVLRAMGLSDERGHASLRFSLGKYTTKDEIDRVVDAVKKAVIQLRSENPVWQMVQQGIELDLEDW